VTVTKKANVFDLIREQNVRDKTKAKKRSARKKEQRKWMKEHPIEVARVMKEHKNDPNVEKEWILKNGELVSRVKNNLQF